MSVCESALVIRKRDAPAKAAVVPPEPEGSDGSAHQRGSDVEVGEDLHDDHAQRDAGRDHDAAERREDRGAQLVHGELVHDKTPCT